MSGIILAFFAGVIACLVIICIREAMASRKIRRMEYAGLRRMAAE